MAPGTSAHFPSHIGIGVYSKVGDICIVAAVGVLENSSKQFSVAICENSRVNIVSTVLLIVKRILYNVLEMISS